MSSGSPHTRARILAATWTLLEDGGGKGVRMSDIAKAAGISRQAVYLHFPNRAELLIATTRHLDDVKSADALMAASRRAETGEESLDAFVRAWGSYIPEIYGVSKALMAMMDTDDEARAALDKRMGEVRQGCEAVVVALARDGRLRPGLSTKRATDLLWTILSVRNWEQLRMTCGWTQPEYISEVLSTCRAALIDPSAKQNGAARAPFSFSG